jgi:uncharacterized membrane protein YfcA
LQNLQYGIATAGRCKPYNGKHYQEAVMLLTLGFLCFFSFMAGLIDAAVGGGGLIQTPALFNFLPQYSAATLFGTNKMSSAVGTLSATRSYLQRVRLPWKLVIPAAITAFVMSFAGAATVNAIPSR